MQDSKTIHEFMKNANEKVRIEHCRFNEKDLLNVRVFYQSDKNEWLPTKKGITFRLDQLPDLKEGIDKASKELERMICSTN
ncbi:transcriptional coactivator p15/PC4 family protein [Acidobacteriota bacterium]